VSLSATIARRPAVATDDLRVEGVLRLLRFGAAAMILAFGQMLPNVGAVFVIVLGIFFAGYGLLISRAWSQVRTSEDRARTARFTLAADISLVGFALFVFSPDPGWTVYVCGFVVIASGGFRIRNGSLLAATSLSLTYVVVMIWRAMDLGMAIGLGQVVIHLGGYVSAGVLLNAVLPELDALREREHELYEPILEAEAEAGDAVLITDGDVPIFWNKTLEQMTGLGAQEIRRVHSMGELVVPSSEPRVDREHDEFRGQLVTRDRPWIDVDVVRREVVGATRPRRVWILRDRTSRDKAEAELRDRALHDGLTGLPNRTLLADRLSSAIAAASRQLTPLSVLVIDLDGFKRVNDENGHHAGDVVLVEIAARLAGAVRESDTAARIGGDEFVLVLPATPVEGAMETARTLATLVGAPILVDGKEVKVGASIGIARYPEQGRDGPALLEAADAAMYEAKRAGGGYRAHAGRTA
jgi:diguanylate cyclase (GGDEF)-like protein